MAVQKKYFYPLLLLCAVMTVFSGCASNTPITKDIIRQVKESDNKLPKDFQYYVSKKITLNLVEPKAAYTVKSGKLIITNRTKREQITIAENLRGLVYTDVTEADDGGYTLEVHFEKKYPDCFIKFKQLRPGDYESYYFIYDDIQNSAIKYGDDNYIVSFEGIDPPYLWIKMRSREKPDKKQRKASGVRLR